MANVHTNLYITFKWACFKIFWKLEKWSSDFRGDGMLIGKMAI